MVSVRISELKAALSRYLDRVRSGEEVVVTDRGKPVAKLVPLGAERFQAAGHLEALEREGVVRRGTNRLPPDFWRRSRPRDMGGSVRRAVLEDRDDR
jgi:prevent-host-death family protein